MVESMREGVARPLPVCNFALMVAVDCCWSKPRGGAGRVGDHRRRQGAVVVERRGDGVVHCGEGPYHDVLGVVSVDGAEVGRGRREWGRREVLSRLPWVRTPVGMLRVVLWALPPNFMN